MLQIFKRNIFFYTTVLLLILTISASYYRFMISYDYLVTYEGDCDPYSSVCYQYCEDDECTEPFHHTWMTRGAATLKENCDEDITMCDFAYECTPTEEFCEIAYCDLELEADECELLEEADQPSEEIDLNVLES